MKAKLSFQTGGIFIGTIIVAIYAYLTPVLHLRIVLATQFYI